MNMWRALVAVFAVDDLCCANIRMVCCLAARGGKIVHSDVVRTHIHHKYVKDCPATPVNLWYVRVRSLTHLGISRVLCDSTAANETAICTLHNAESETSMDYLFG